MAKFWKQQRDPRRARPFGISDLPMPFGVPAAEPAAAGAARAEAHRPPGGDEFAPLVTGGEAVAGGEHGELGGDHLEILGPAVKKTANLAFGHCRERLLDFILVAA